MNTTVATTATTASRIHPLVAGAAVSVIVASLVGVAAMAGWLPSSHSATAPVSAVPTDVAAMTPASASALAAPMPAPVAAPAPVIAQVAPEPAPVVRKRVHHTQVAQAPVYNDDNGYREPVRQQQPVQAQAPAQPNYVGIGAGAVIGGLLGNHVGGGRGKALATVAGVIGGGMLGNAVQNEVQQPQR